MFLCPSFRIQCIITRIISNYNNICRLIVLHHTKHDDAFFKATVCVWMVLHWHRSLSIDPIETGPPAWQSVQAVAMPMRKMWINWCSSARVICIFIHRQSQQLHHRRWNTEQGGPDRRSCCTWLVKAPETRYRRCSRSTHGASCGKCGKKWHNIVLRDCAFTLKFRNFITSVSWSRARGNPSLIFIMRNTGILLYRLWFYR